MLKLVTGRSGSGKTQRLINLMKNSENAIYIVPEQYSFAAEKKITHAFGISGMGNPDVYSFKRLGYHMEEMLGGEGSSSITSAGRVMVLYDIVKKLSDSLTLFGGSAKRGEMAEEAEVIVTTMKQYSVTEEKLRCAIEKTDNSLLKKKLSDCLIIMKAYDEFLKSGYRDSEDVLEGLRRNAENTAYFEDKDVFIDSFTAFTPLEMSVIGTLMKKSKSVTLSLCIGEGGEEFSTANSTRSALIKLCKDNSIPFAEEKVSGAMFTACDELKTLEKSFFEAAVYNKDTEKIRVFCQKNQYEEAYVAATEIERLCRDEGYRYRDIAIVAREMDEYEKEFTRVFNSFEIPLFMDKKTPLSGEAAAVFMLSAVRIISRGWKNEDVFSYMKTAFSPLSASEGDEMENYCILTGVRARDWKSGEEWTMGAGVKEEEADKDYLAKINEYKNRLTKPLINLEGKIKGKKTGREFAIGLYEFMEECALEEKINSIAEKMEECGESAVSGRMKQVYDMMIGVLESFDGAFSDKVMSSGDFLGIITKGMECVEIGIIPQTTDSVCAGSIDRVRGHGAKAVIIVGANEGKFPLAPKEQGIFSNADRRELAKYEIELPPDTLGKAHMEESLVYGALTCGTDLLFVTYNQGGENPAPSSIVKRIRKVFPCVREEQGEIRVTSARSAYENFVVEFAKIIRGEEVKPMWYSALDYYKNHHEWKDKIKEIEKYSSYESKTALVKSELLQARFKSGMKTSVSALEKYSKCPFSYFANVVLSLKERKELEVTAADSGTFLHEFVDAFGKSLKGDGKTWQSIDEEYIDRKTEEIVLELLNGVNKHLIETSPRIRHLFTELKRIAKRSVTVLSEHMKKGRFEPLGYEIIFDDKGDFKPLKIDLPNGTRVTLRGRVDRADILQTDRGKFVRIIDYKSGDKKFSLSNIYNGMDLQLAVYLTAICENGNYQPAGMLYFKIDDPIIDASSDTEDSLIREKIINELKMDGLVLEDDEILEAMDVNYARGSSVIPVKKKKDGTFSSNSRVATESDFKALSKHVTKTVRKLCGEILSGQNGIKPVRGACDWCEMKSLCGFDTAIKGCSYRYVEKLNDKDALLKIIEEEKSAEGKSV